MMNVASPNKRRALAPVDANTRSSLGTPPPSCSKLNQTRSKMAFGSSPVRSNTAKRPIDQENVLETPSSVKRRRLSHAGTEPLSPWNKKPLQQAIEDPSRPRSVSPSGSSIFDSSTINNSQVTAPSEADAGTTTPASAIAESRSRPRSMTREEVRQKAEILRLRLGLANYKVKTNQTDVPLEKLQARRVPGKFLSPSSSTVSLPPMLASSPGHIKAVSRRDEGRRLASPAKSEGATPGSAMPSIGPSHRRIESGSSSISQTEVLDETTPARREVLQTIATAILNTPQRKFTNNENDPSDNGRGGAAEGLLSLSQSSPASSAQ